MNSIRSAAAACVLSVLSLQTICTHAAGPDTAQFEDEIAKQKGIYESTGQAVPQGYVVGRSLLSYTLYLSSDFMRSLAELGPGDRWLDVGAGQGRAVLDYVTSKYDAMLKSDEPHRGKARGVAMSIEDRRTHEWYDTLAKIPPGQIEYVFGRRLREYAPHELGRFRLITDVLGGFSYTRFMSVFMEKALGLLEVNGTFFTVLQDVHSEAGTNAPFYPGASFLTEITKPDGSELKVCSWLKSISCVEVTCDFKPASAPPIEMYRIRKTCEKVRVPALVGTHFEAGTPPERRFELVDPAARLARTRDHASY